MSTSTLVLVIAVVLFWTARRRARWRRDNGITRHSRKWTVVTVVAAILGLQIVLGIPAYADTCGDAPIPEVPGAGMVGAIDPPNAGQGAKGTNYHNYGYAGTVWHVFDNNCGVSKAIADPNAVIDTWAGNELFNVGKNVVGATNSLHYQMLSSNSIFTPIDSAVQNAAKVFYQNIYVRWFGPVALLLAILLFRYVWTGDLASISRRTLWALAGMWLAASVLLIGPVYGQMDSLLLQKTSQIQGGFLDSNQAGDPVNALPESLYDNVVYRNWLRGEFGSPDAPQAQQFGGELLGDQAISKTDESPNDQNLVTAKQNDFKTLPDKLGSAAGFFEGTEGSRTGDGFLAMFEAFAYSLFQLFAKAAVLLAQVLLRILLLASPLIGLAAMLLPELLPRVAKAGGAVLFNVLLLSALAGMHALLLNIIFGAGTQLSLLAQILLASLITIVFFMVGRPLRRMWQMVELSVAAAGLGFPSTSGGMLSRLRKRNADPSPQERFWGTVRGGTRAADADDQRVRPEGFGEPTGVITATARRMDRRADTGGRRQLNGAAGALPAAALPAARPYGPSGPATAVPEAMSSRIVDSPPTVDRGWDRGEDSFVVPSQVRRGDREGPRRAETEMVAGKPVFVLYRPSRGLEVSDGGWDSRSARS